MTTDGEPTEREPDDDLGSSTTVWMLPVVALLIIAGFLVYTFSYR